MKNTETQQTKLPKKAREYKSHLVPQSLLTLEVTHHVSEAIKNIRSWDNKELAHFYAQLNQSDDLEREEEYRYMQSREGGIYE